MPAKVFAVVAYLIALAGAGLFLAYVVGTGVGLWPRDQAADGQLSIQIDFGLLMLFGATERIMHTWDVAGGVARAYDEEGAEIVAVPLREPTFVRPFEFATEVAGEPMTGYRHNT